MDADNGWWVVNGTTLLRMMRRVRSGESPDWVYAEEYANSDHASWPSLSLDIHGEDAVMSRDFYRCPNTGEWVYRWADERVVAVLPSGGDS